MFDLDWGKLALIGAIALIVIGPKDLPKALRMAGFWVRKARSMASEFQSSVEQMAREAELQELREKVEKASRMDVEGEIRKTVDPDNTIGQAFTPPPMDDPAAIIADPLSTPTSPTPESIVVGSDYPTSLHGTPEPAPAEIPLTEPAPAPSPTVIASVEPTPVPAETSALTPPVDPATPSHKQV
jgi:sec-independent protein translocase protein TatB